MLPVLQKKGPGMRNWLMVFMVLVMMVPAVSCRSDGVPVLQHYQIDKDTGGVIECVNNIYNTCIVSNDASDYKAEYEAGFIQGRLQKDQIVAARDNGWDSAYLVDPDHLYPKQLPPSRDELELAQRTMAMNWDYTVDYIRRQGNSTVGRNLRRLMYRFVGIYHGAVKNAPEALQFDDQWFPSFSDEEMQVGYETKSLTFMDLYFLNAFNDLFYVLPDYAPAKVAASPGKCSAFVKKTQDDIIMTHNMWQVFLNQSQALSIWVNGDFLTLNICAPGYLGSGSDFGYSNKGIIFNETTHRYAYTEPEVRSLWMFWQIALAEQFAASIDEFFNYVSLEPTGTYMNGYMLVDARTKEIGLVETSYKSFILFKSDADNGIKVVTRPEGLNTAYDQEMVGPGYILGMNYPASLQIREDLKSADNRPARKRQLVAQIGSVNDIESAKALITYTDPENPLSIFGRWDLGYGETPTPKTIPDGAVDAKAVSASMVQETFSLKGILDTKSPVKTFWMVFASPRVNGKPFVWSESQWKDTKLRFVPDRIDGDFTLLNSYIR
jgi:hypothetical protein